MVSSRTQSLAGLQALNRTVTTITSVWCYVLTSHFCFSLNTVEVLTHMYLYVFSRYTASGGSPEAAQPKALE